jgi:hypothetical protein
MGELYQVALDLSREKSDPLQKKKTPTKKGGSVNLRTAGRKRRKNYPPIWDGYSGLLLLSRLCIIPPHIVGIHPVITGYWIEEDGI